jgi:hypothetical protein
MTKASDDAAELPVTIRPQKDSALARLANAARATGSRGALSEMVHGWAQKHEAEVVKAATPPPDTRAFD